MIVEADLREVITVPGWLRPTMLVDCGSICAALECATGRKPLAVPGKPEGLSVVFLDDIRLEKAMGGWRYSDKELKTVRRNLRSEIEQLGTAVKFMNIFMVPLLIGIGGIIYAITRRRKA